MNRDFNPACFARRSAPGRDRRRFKNHTSVCDAETFERCGHKERSVPGERCVGGSVPLWIVEARYADFRIAMVPEVCDDHGERAVRIGCLRSVDRKEHFRRWRRLSHHPRLGCWCRYRWGWCWYHGCWGDRGCCASRRCGAASVGTHPSVRPPRQHHQQDCQDDADNPMPPVVRARGFGHVVWSFHLTSPGQRLPASSTFCSAASSVQRLLAARPACSGQVSGTASLKFGPPASRIGRICAGVICDKA